MLCGRLLRIWAMVLRTSFTDLSMSVPSANSTVVEDAPSVIVEVMWRTPVMPANAFSIRVVTDFSISSGDAPDCATETVTIGKLTLGSALMGSRWKESVPITVSTMNSTIVNIGLRMAHEEILKFM